MQDLALDWPTFHRLDNAAVVDFLSSTASAFADKGLLTAKDIDDLRLNLSAINARSEARAQPLLLALEGQASDFLALLEARYGRQVFV